ncbi:MAG: hypothetical protein AUI52_05495 [Acidobacteria bacterium 13_1_40CM_2_68_10]|nr:MAG: hypothetical protein AUI52_05495 [Acidobacteria bacterium 13_1_40CM_2_68_10]
MGAVGTAPRQALDRPGLGPVGTCRLCGKAVLLFTDLAGIRRLEGHGTGHGPCAGRGMTPQDVPDPFHVGPEGFYVQPHVARRS